MKKIVLLSSLWLSGSILAMGQDKLEINIKNNNDYYSIVTLFDVDNAAVPLTNNNYETLCKYIQQDQDGNPSDLTHSSYFFPKEPVKITLTNLKFPLMLQFAQAGGSFPELSFSQSSPAEIIRKRKQIYQVTLLMTVNKPTKK